MSSITAQQTKLDLELVPKEKRLEIGKCNGRINPRKKQREPTFQVVWEARALTPCYSAFLTTADVPKVCMHQFWDSIHKYENFYRFRMDKKKKFDLNLEIFRDIFQICPRVLGQNFDELPTDEDIMSFFKEFGHTREFKTITDIVVDQMHQPWRTFATIINRSLSEKLDWDNPECGDYPFDLTKRLPLVMNGNRQIVSVEYFFNNDLKYLQGGISTMTYTTSITKTKATQYDILKIEDTVQNIWCHVKVAYDKHALWGISHWRDQRKTYYGYARGLESTHDVYSTKHIMAVNRVEVMRKHGYGYLREIEVRRADNDLYAIKEGDFLRLRINDIERSYLQLGVKSYQKKINVTKPETTKLDIKKKDPYTPYQDHQGFIYVETLGRNSLMCSDELYKFSDGTLTRFRTLLDDITKNIRMDYLPQRRWGTLEKKKANIMIKAIDK
nr:hypothetical protein [Tanacetum cinerariifolium]